MTKEKVYKTIEELESIIPEEEYAYEKAILAYVDKTDQAVPPKPE